VFLKMSLNRHDKPIRCALHCHCYKWILNKRYSSGARTYAPHKQYETCGILRTLRDVNGSRIYALQGDVSNVTLTDVIVVNFIIHT
jgi:hypothetical protein